MNLEQIDTSTTAGKAEVMRLAAEGRKVAMRSQPGAHPMSAADVNLYPYVYCAGIHPSWNWSQCDYAIIAEPVGPDELWLALLPDGKIKGVCETEEEVEYFSLNSVRYIRADLAGDGK